MDRRPVTDLPNPLRLTHLTWPEVEAAREHVRLVAVPLGSLEQHGPNSSFDTDSVIAEDLTLRLAARFHPQILVAPTVPFGMSAYHMGFPGTVTLRPTTFLHVLEDNLASLIHHGFTSFLFTNWHNGNEPVMELALQQLPTRYPIEFLGALSYYDLEDDELVKEMLTGETWGHADEIETAELMVLRPDRVKSAALSPGQVAESGTIMRSRFWRRDIRINFDFSEFTSNGAVGDATKSDLQAGRRMIELIERRSDELIRAILDAPPELLAKGRIPQWRNGRVAE